jgi:hypothetical protein
LSEVMRPLARLRTVSPETLSRATILRFLETRAALGI